MRDHDRTAQVALDVHGLRALAHPVRVQLLGLLRTDGPSTATLLARRLGQTSGTISYHLRQLGAAGFVEEDREAGNARERWWRPVHQSTSLDRELAEREPATALNYLRSVVAAYTVHTRRALDEFSSMPRAWQDVFEVSDWTLRLTPEEAGRLREELKTVIARYRDTAATGEDAERVSLILQVLPGAQDGSS
jgi:DNA-binding transcriptional ArsR family regulator